jgi:exopolysaccharide production protein ExoZ
VFAISLALPQRWRLSSLLVLFASLVGIGLLAGPSSSAIVDTYTSPLLLEFAAGVVIARLYIAGRLVVPVVLAASLFVAGWALITASTTASVLVGCAFVVASALHPRALALRQPLLKALGDASYSIYLTHLVALGLQRSLWSKLLSTPDTPALALLFVAIGLVTSAAVGCLVYAVAERPLTRWLNEKLSAGKSGKPIPVEAANA